MTPPGVGSHTRSVSENAPLPAAVVGVGRYVRRLSSAHEEWYDPLLVGESAMVTDEAVVASAMEYRMPIVGEEDPVG
ncbi:MAG: hypothetical protein ACC667_12055, partial [Longimicrobiales bacterium]